MSETPLGADTRAPDDDASLGGYFRVHDRPPAYEGPDGHPYTVSVEVEKTGDLKAPYSGFLVFPRWAQNGVGIVGHTETPTLVRGTTSEEVTSKLGEMTLHDVQQLLTEAVAAQQGLDADSEGG